jgi:hypothetical protein
MRRYQYALLLLVSLHQSLGYILNIAGLAPNVNVHFSMSLCFMRTHLLLISHVLITNMVLRIAFVGSICYGKTYRKI